MHDEIVTLRHGAEDCHPPWLAGIPTRPVAALPDQGKLSHRPWFSPAEYKQLYEATRAYAKAPFHEHYKWNAEQVYDYVLFMANTGLRPGRGEEPPAPRRGNR